MGGGCSYVSHLRHFVHCLTAFCVCVCVHVCVCVRACDTMYSFTLCCLRSGRDYNQQAALYLPAVCVCWCCCRPVVGHSSYQSRSPALLAEKSSHDAALKKLPGSPFRAECADTLGWSVFVLAPLLVVVLTLKRCYTALNLPSWAEAAHPARPAEITLNRQNWGAAHYSD